MKNMCHQSLISKRHGTLDAPPRLPMAAQPTQNTPWNPVIDEPRWVVQIRRYLEEELEDETGVPVCISNVPKQLSASKPEAYIPQDVALGPYHHWRPELYEMERYKIAAAKRTQKRLKSSNFQSLVDWFVKLEPRIRSCYHRYLDYSGETLAWMMAVDASFLLEFLWIFTAKDSEILRRLSSRMTHLVDYSGTRSSHNAILRDIMMLENQIPLFLLRKILESQCSSLDESGEQLTKILTELCKELSPFKAIDIFQKIQVKERAHLLELLYYVVVPKSERTVVSVESNEQDVILEVTMEESMANKGYAHKFLKKMWGHLSSLNLRPVRLIKGAFTSRPVKFVVKLPWTVLTKLPGLSLLKQPVEYLFMSSEKADTKKEDGDPSQDANRPPSIEEITIPSVSELIEVGVKFSATTGDLSTIRFDEKTITFYLPTVTLDVNTEVILRNLVAFETSIDCGPLVFTRYTELMNGIIDTEEDVKVLRETRIVSNCLKSDGEVASLWNGMSKSLRLAKVPLLDKVIEDVNRYYSSRWRVKVGKFMKTYVFGSWQFLTFLAAILLLAMTGLEAFCSVYTCSRWFNFDSKQ